MRNPRIEEYLSRFRLCLVGRLPDSRVELMVTEVESHLSDLVEDFAAKHEPDPEGRAIARFGQPRRLAKRLLRELETMPSEREAARWPLWIGGIAAVLSTVFWVVFSEPGASSFARPSIDLAFYVASILLSVAFIYACFRGRRMLFKPLLFLCAGMFAAHLLVLSAISVSVPTGDGGYRSILRVHAGAYVAEANVRIRAIDDQMVLLERGKRLFQGEPKDVPNYRMFNGEYLTPASGVRVYSSAQIFLPRLPLFMQVVPNRPPGPTTWAGAVEAWKETDATLAYLRTRREAETHAAANMEMALKQGPMTYLRLWTLPRAVISVSYLVLLLYMNLVGWLLSHLYRRALWPRRRYARR